MNLLTNEEREEAKVGCIEFDKVSYEKRMATVTVFMDKVNDSMTLEKMLGARYHEDKKSADIIFMRRALKELKDIVSTAACNIAIYPPLSSEEIFFDALTELEDLPSKLIDVYSKDVHVVDLEKVLESGERFVTEIVDMYKGSFKK